MEVALVPLFTRRSPFLPLHWIASLAMGPSALAHPTTFDLGVTTTAITVNFLLAMLYAVVLDLFVRRLAVVSAVLGGAVFGVILYLVNFYLMTGLFPWFTAGRGLVTAFNSLAYGAITAGAYEALREFDPVSGARLPRL
jgi:hypothetical protein